MPRYKDVMGHIEVYDSMTNEFLFTADNLHEAEQEYKENYLSTYIKLYDLSEMFSNRL